MIDIDTERMIGLPAVAKMFPSGRTGKPTHISTLVNAITKGKNGVKLEAVRLGSRWFTSVEAVQRWCEALADAKLGKQTPVPQSRSVAKRRAAAERAARQLEAVGI